jgi:hypothetical protein
MAKLNYNRPSFNKNLGERAWITPKKHKPLDSTHAQHELKKSYATNPHYGRLDCVTCNKFVKWLSSSEFSNYK